MSSENPFGACPVPISQTDEILLAHGSGGKLTSQLVEGLLLPAFRNAILEPLEDQAVVPVNGTRVAFTTDSYVVTPIFFPGGDIGELAVNGTVNDLAVGGARPLFLSLAFILEEGLPIADFRRVVESVRRAAERAGVQVVTGDTKVVNRGKGDKVFVNTAGIGELLPGARVSTSRVQEGDAVLLSGTIGDHGITILAQRDGIDLGSGFASDTAPLHDLVARMIEAFPDIHAMRDPTRGGVAASLVEIASRRKVGIAIDEQAVPIREEVRGACEILGLDPLYVACEGRFAACVDARHADAVLAALHAHPAGASAAVVGEVRDRPAGMVLLRTGFGGTRVLDMLVGDPLPRIC
jgi:hydrogenase expression/formation protein HypE